MCSAAFGAGQDRELNRPVWLREPTGFVSLTFYIFACEHMKTYALHTSHHQNNIGQPLVVVSYTVNQIVLVLPTFRHVAGSHLPASVDLRGVV